jgi:hypothetical protein
MFTYFTAGCKIAKSIKEFIHTSPPTIVHKTYDILLVSSVGI